MSYERKIIILNEVTGGFSTSQPVRGTLLMEKNGPRVTCSLTVLNLRNAERGEYLFGITLHDKRAEVKHLGRNGRISTKFELPSGSSLEGRILCVLAYADDTRSVPVAFGGSDNKKVWPGNMLDGIIRRPEFFSPPPRPNPPPAPPRPAPAPVPPRPQPVPPPTPPSPGNRPSGPQNPGPGGSGPNPQPGNRPGPNQPPPQPGRPRTMDTAAKGSVEELLTISAESVMEQPTYDRHGSFGLTEDGREELTGSPQSSDMPGDADNGEHATIHTGKETAEEPETENDAQKKAEKLSSPFLDILPKDDDYHDNAVAIKNYYPDDYGQDLFGEAGYTQVNPAEKKSLDLFNVDYLEDCFDPEPRQPVKTYSVSDQPATDRVSAFMPMEDTPPIQQDRLRHPQTRVDTNGQTLRRQDTLLEHEPETALHDRRFAQQVPPPHGQQHSLREDETEPLARQAAPHILRAQAAKKKEPLIGLRPDGQAPKTDGSRYYDKIKPQIDSLFSKFPRAEDIEQLLPDTKWVKVDYDGNGKYYVIGLIGEEPSYVCYGVRGNYAPEPPKELDGYCQWFPIDFKNPQGEGYWLMYQDAGTGESVDVELV